MLSSPFTHYFSATFLCFLCKRSVNDCVHVFLNRQLGVITPVRLLLEDLNKENEYQSFIYKGDKDPGFENEESEVEKDSS